MAVWGQVRHLSVTEAPNNIKFHEWGVKKTFFFKTWKPESGSNPRLPTFQAGSFNHCTTAHAEPQPQNTLYIPD